MNKKRTSNIELLRIVAMLMIIFYHIVCHGVAPQLAAQSSIELGKKYFLLNLVYPWGPVGNALFLLISGYFMTPKGGSVNLLAISKKLLFQLIYAVVALVFISNLTFRVLGYNHNIVFENFMSINYGRAWFIGYYFLVILIGALFLNEYLLKIDKTKFSILLTIIFSVTQFSWSAGLINGISDHLNLLLTGVFLYSFGGYIRQFDPLQKYRTFTFFLIIAFLNLMIYISSVNFKKIIPHNDSSLLVIVLSICIFELFRRIKLPSIKLINFLGSSTFMVYLFHDCPFGYSMWSLKDWLTPLDKTPMIFVRDLCVIGALTFLAGTILYITYLLLLKIANKAKFIFIKNT